MVKTSEYVKNNVAHWILRLFLQIRHVVDKTLLSKTRIFLWIGPILVKKKNTESKSLKF